MGGTEVGAESVFSTKDARACRRHGTLWPHLNAQRLLVWALSTVKLSQQSLNETGDIFHSDLVQVYSESDAHHPLNGTIVAKIESRRDIAVEQYLSSKAYSDSTYIGRFCMTPE
mmetsp:Transcript_22196/g.32681  ORF Transcript_22196/g.32681 Transcript_22196/m.32681 type:complete len:114 (+) Transcript_22196:589-930(+)